VAVWIWSPLALASEEGIVGRADEGCRPCHGTVVDPATTVVLEGASPVAPGAVVDVVVRVTTGDPDRLAAGVDVIATGGELVAGAGTHLVAGELTHDAPVPFVGGQAELAFTWRAPDEPGTWRIRAAGNAVDGNGLATGDGWALAPALAIRVEEPDTGHPGSGSGGSTAGSGCGCGSSAPAAGGWVALVVLARCRRRSARRYGGTGDSTQPSARSVATRASTTSWTFLADMRVPTSTVPVSPG
jgi:hypothetical protein